jgi:transcriptional regulator GlxA family with amidase domain
LKRDDALFTAWERDLRSGQSEAAQIAALEVEARLRRLALHNATAEVRVKSTQGELRHVEKMAAFMAQNYEAALGIEEIAHAAGVHPNYAMNLFKREFGLSLGEFLLRTRLSHAQRLLATTDRKVLDIAFGCGFGSASRFHAAFKMHCGQSPAAYRKALKDAAG